MKRIIVNVLIVSQILFLTSCLSTRDTNLLQKPGGDIPAYSKFATPEEYRLKVGDQLSVVLTTSPADAPTTQLFSYFSSQYFGLDSRRALPVQPDGTIYFPYLGSIYVKGKTTMEVQQLLKQKIHQSISEYCVVKVYLENRYYSVVGEAGVVGRYLIPKEQMTIFQALAQCKDIQPYGDRKHLKIIRQIDNGTIIRSFDIRSRDVINSEFYYIQPNDVICIESMGRQFWGINSLGSAFAVFSTVISFGFMVYNLVK